MKEINDGGAAFPSGWGSEGMTLRDYFAAKAMQGILSDQATILRFDESGKRELVQPFCLVATAAYAMADAMIAEGSK